MLNMNQNVNIENVGLHYMFQVVNVFPYIGDAMEMHYRSMSYLSLHVYSHLEDTSFQKMYGLSGIIGFP